MGIQFRVLGALEVLRDGVAVQPTSAKQRVLLAVLVVRAGEVVPARPAVLASDHERTNTKQMRQPARFRQRRNQRASADDDFYLPNQMCRKRVTIKTGYRREKPSDHAYSCCKPDYLRNARSKMEKSYASEELN